MKKLNHLSGILISMLFILLGMLFDFMSWDIEPLVSGLLIISGIGGLVFILIQLAAKYYCERSKG